VVLSTARSGHAYMMSSRGGAEIGRQGRLKLCCSKGRVGSSPTRRTTPRDGYDDRKGVVGMGRFLDLWRGNQGAHVDSFRLSMGTGDAEAACHHALRSPDWSESATAEAEIPLTAAGSDQEAVAWLIDELSGGRSDRWTTRSARVPEGPPGADARVYGVWQARVVIGISLHEDGSDGTRLTLTGAGLPGVGAAMVRSAMGELRRSIDIQSGSLTPHRPPTR
jgi:hypothetical protein